MSDCMQCALELACIHMNVFARVAMSVGLSACPSVRPSVCCDWVLQSQDFHIEMFVKLFTTFTTTTSAPS